MVGTVNGWTRKEILGTAYLYFAAHLAANPVAMMHSPNRLES
jgi:hypothetical protein